MSSLVLSYPGLSTFQPNKMSIANVHLSHQLIKKGYIGHHDGYGYKVSSVFTIYTQKNVQEFQLAELSESSEVNGIPGPLTWQKLFEP